jgi:hypothetical protein
VTKIQAAAKMVFAAGSNLRTPHAPTSGRDQEHVDSAHVGRLPEPGLQIADGLAVGLDHVGVDVRTFEPRAHLLAREGLAIPVGHKLGIGLAIVGTVALAANVLRDDGYFASPTETFSTGAYAIATDTGDVSDAPEWAFGDFGLDTVRVKAQSDLPLFIGIARARPPPSVTSLVNSA